MFPDEVMDTAIFQYGLENFVTVLVCCCRSADRYVIYIEDGELGNLQL